MYYDVLRGNVLYMYESRLHTLEQQPPLAPAVVVCSELALDTPIKLLELCLALLTTLQGVHGTHY